MTVEGIHYTVEVIVHEVHDAEPPKTDRYGKVDGPGRDRRVIDLTRVTTRSPLPLVAIDKAIALLSLEREYQMPRSSTGGIIK